MGAGLYARTDAQVATLRAQLDREPSAFFAAERPRMERVQRNFVWVERVELALLVVGVVLALAGKGAPVAWGVGTGMVVQASVMLAFDLLAERRGAAWLKQAVDLSPSDPTVLVLGGAPSGLPLRIRLGDATAVLATPPAPE